MLAKQKGQATLEYLMLFTVTLFIVGGLMFQFNDAFRNFVNNYFGAYLSCLLESGELPTLGFEASNPEDETCNSEFEAFNFASGRRPISGEFATNPGNLPPYEPKTFRENPPPPYDANGNKESVAQGPASESKLNNSGGGTVGGGGGRPLSTFGESPKSTSADTAKKSQQDDQLGTGGSSSDDVAVQRNQPKEEDDRPTFVPLTAKEVEDEAVKPKKTVPATEVDVQRETRRVPAEELKKKKAQDTDEAGLNFSDLLKYLLIFGIIVAMAIFLGGQAVQISKSREK